MFSQLRLPTRQSHTSSSADTSPSPSPSLSPEPEPGMANVNVSRKTLAATYVTLTTPGGRILTVRSDEVDFIDLELCDQLLDPTPPPGWTSDSPSSSLHRGPKARSEERKFDMFLKGLAVLPVQERNVKMKEEMKRMMDRAEKAMRVHASLREEDEEGEGDDEEGEEEEGGRFRGVWLIAKNYHDTMLCHINHGKDLWEEAKWDGTERVYVHQEHLKDAWVRGREVEEFLKE